ncbi:MAG: SDR family NAD(P)-dependent oxidoreductase [Oscillospiraceae bacterium]|nr:SDR family NAD(P)-dependent oxidoreductase [Oscillospiraceae bacterium]
MIALVTGASSGIGRDIARSLARHGINLIITARREKRLAELKRELVKKYGVKVKIITADLSDERQVLELYEKVKKYSIDIFINNAGLGVFGEFTQTDLWSELNMLNVNIRAFHILFKLFVRDFTERDFGYILNTASVAGFLPGPYFSSYYASKAYIVRMTQAIQQELIMKNSSVNLSLLCPGPVATEFGETANVKFITPQANSARLAEHAVREMFGGTFLICENPLVKAGIYASKLVPDPILAIGAGFFQKRRKK